MTYSKEALARVHHRFAETRASREALIAARKSDLFARYPRLAELEDETARLAYRVFSDVATHNASPDAIADKIKRELQRINRERAEILQKDGKDKDYLNPPFACPVCRDTGFVGTKMCTCFEAALVSELFSASNLSERMQKETFEAMRSDCYSDQPDDSIGTSLKEYMASIKAICLDFVERFDRKPRHLLFQGASGLGKTYYSSAIANALLQKGKRVCYQSASLLFPLLQQTAFGKQPEEYEKLKEKLMEADLLILDDVGTEMVTNFTITEFFNILNLRLLDAKPMIISTNLSMKDIKDTYSERIYSRLSGEFTPCVFMGRDLRKVL